VCDEEKDNCDQLGIEVFEDNDAPEIESQESACHHVTVLPGELPPAKSGAESQEALDFVPKISRTREILPTTMANLTIFH